MLRALPIDPGFPWRASVSTASSSHTYVHTHTHTSTHSTTYWNSEWGPGRGSFAHIWAKEETGQVCVVRTPLEPAFLSAQRTNTHTQNACTHKMLLLSVCTQTKLHLDLWRLSYAAKLLTLQSACEWQTCESGLLLYKQRRVMRKGKCRKKMKEWVKW